MRADLHVHSTYSDGLYSPDEICRQAKENGVDFLSITDHDTLAGLDVKRAAAKKYGLSYVSGWEISAYAGTDKVHILGYGCTLGKAYEEFMEKRTAAAEARARESVAKFRQLGIPMSLTDVENMRKDSSTPFHTMHVARAAALYLGISAGEVYVNYLAVGKPCNSNIGRPTPEEAIDCIHALGGIASIAHPGRIFMPIEERNALIERLVDYGVDGIEALYSTHTDEETAYFLNFAKRKGLLVTGGSDTHYKDERHEIGIPAFYPTEKLLSALFGKVE